MLGEQFQSLPIESIVNQLNTMLEQAKLLISGVNKHSSDGLLTDDIVMSAGVLQRMIDRIEK